MQGNREYGNRLPKREKLRHRGLVEGLFAHGTSLYDYPLRVTYRILSPGELRDSFRTGIPLRVGRTQMLVTVPKKKQRRAVSRVLLRRRIRESYRLCSHGLRDAAASNPAVGSVGMAFIYISPEKEDYALINRKMNRLLEKITQAVRGYGDA